MAIKISGVNAINDDRSANVTALTLQANTVIGLASQAEAEAGTATDKLMTPQRTAQAISELAPNIITLPEQTFATSNVFSFAHGLATTPRDFIGFLRCTTASNGFTANDIIKVGLWQDSTTQGATMRANTSEVTVSVAGTFAVFNPSGSYAALTPSNFNIFVRVLE
jgi:hypothetical protein